MNAVAEKAEKVRRGYFLDAKQMKRFNHICVELGSRYETKFVEEAIGDFCDKHRGKEGVQR